MKRVTAAIALGLLIISACILYLVHTGISLRAAPLIQPSVMNSDQSNVAASLVVRLFQEFQNSHYVLWGVLPQTEESARIMNNVSEQYEKTFHRTVSFIRDAENASKEYLSACAKPCWLLFSADKAHQLVRNEFIENKLAPISRPFFTMTLIPFHKNEPVSAKCEQEKFLSLNCLIPIAVRGVQKKIKDPGSRYFFLQKYNEKDYFLFIQQIL